MSVRVVVSTLLLFPLSASAQYDLAYEFEPRELVFGKPTDMFISFRNVSGHDIEFGGAGWDFSVDESLGALTTEYAWNSDFIPDCWDFAGGTRPDAVDAACHNSPLISSGESVLLGTLPASAAALGEFQLGVLHRYAIDFAFNELQVDPGNTATTITVVPEPGAFVLVVVGAAAATRLHKRRATGCDAGRAESTGMGRPALSV